MAQHDFNTAARSLALPIDDPFDDDDDLFPSPTQTQRPSDSSWQRRSQSASPVTQRPQRRRDRWRADAQKWWDRYLKLWYSFSPLQQAGILVLNFALFVLVVLFLVYSDPIFTKLTGVVKSWREMPAGWLILWFLIFFVSFPPMIGYSTCITIAGFVYGMNGWFICATATVLGSTASFIVSRTVLKGFVGRMAEKNKRFAALSLVLKHDGLKLLTMIRLCPLPYSLSNGAISTIPTVTWQNFALATALATPKLLLGVFVGGRLGDLAENGDKMDTKTKIVSYVGIFIGITAGIATGYLVYVRTKARARELEAEEARDAVAVGPRTGSAGSGYSDDPDEQDAVDLLRREASRGSQRQPRTDGVDVDLEAGEGEYADDFSDEEDAQERDVFDAGDDVDDIDESKDAKGRR